MRLVELFEAKQYKKLVVPASKPIDPNKKTMDAISKSGAAGPHTPKKFNRKEKHKKPVMEFVIGNSNGGNNGDDNYEDLLFTLAYCWYNNGPTFTSEEAERKLSLLGWNPEFGDDYVGVILYKIGGGASRQYTIDELDGDNED